MQLETLLREYQWLNLDICCLLQELILGEYLKATTSKKMSTYDHRTLSRDVDKMLKKI